MFWKVSYNPKHSVILWPLLCQTLSLQSSCPKCALLHSVAMAGKVPFFPEGKFLQTPKLWEKAADQTTWNGKGSDQNSLNCTHKMDKNSKKCIYIMNSFQGKRTYSWPTADSSPRRQSILFAVHTLLRMSATLQCIYTANILRCLVQWAATAHCCPVN